MPVLTKIDAFRASCLLANAEQNSTASSAASSSVSCGIKYAATRSNTPAFSHATLTSSPSSVAGRCASVNKPSISIATSVPGGSSNKKPSINDRTNRASRIAAFTTRTTEGQSRASPARRNTLRAIFKPSASLRRKRPARNARNGFPFSYPASASAHRASAERFTAKPATVGALCATESVSETRSSASSARSVPETGRATAKNRRRRSSTLAWYRSASATFACVAFRAKTHRRGSNARSCMASRARSWKETFSNRRSVAETSTSGTPSARKRATRATTSSRKGSFSFSERLVAELVSPLVPTSDFRSPSSSSPRSISSTFSLRTLSLRRNVTHKTSRSTSPRVPTHSIKYETTSRFFILRSTATSSATFRSK